MTTVPSITRILCLLIALALPACATVSRDIEPPHFNVVNIAPKDVGLFEQRYDVQLRIENPNDTDLGIHGLRFEILLNEQQFAYGMSGQRVVVPRFASEMINVEASTGLGSLLRQLQGFNKNGTQTIRYRIKGTAFVDFPASFKLPFDEKGHIDFTAIGGGSELDSTRQEER
jgi:LEA14-like dessication related protein